MTAHLAVANSTVAALLQQTTLDRIDAEVLLAHTLGWSRSHLFARSETKVSATDARRFFELVTQRQQGSPIAYLTGQREFWSLPLMVTQAVLIPRPETELLVELALQQIGPNRARVLDLGTGSGAIALAIACERPNAQVVAIDRCPDALQIARQNASNLGLDRIEFLLSDWYQELSGRCFDLVLANPPYIASDDPHLVAGDLRLEPRRALVADKGGLADLEAIVEHSKKHLTPEGHVIVEHGFDQQQQVIDLFREAGYQRVIGHCDLAHQPRAVIASLLA